jgi:hypothetical protein
MEPTRLHILTRPDDDLAARLVAAQEQTGGDAVRRFDLTGENPDYAGLVEAIFEADSVAVW